MAQQITVKDGKVYGKYDLAWTVSSFEDCDIDPKTGKLEKLPISRTIVFTGYPLEDLVTGFMGNAKVRMNAPLKKLKRAEIVRLRKTEINATDLGLAIVSQEKKDEVAVTVMRRASREAKLAFAEELKREGII